jgi:ATP-dependent Clp protease ATP-binding subunit ClpB
VDFKNAVLIMTSNIGSQWIQDLGEQDSTEMRRRVTEALRASFRPEFLNRVDETIIFQSLSREHLGQIVEIQLRYLRARLREKKVSLALTDRAKAWLAEHGYDPVYGARPLKRTIQRAIQDPLALKLLTGEFQEGDTITADTDEQRETLQFRRG